MKGAGGILGPVKAYYDKVLAGLALVILILCAGWAVTQVGLMRRNAIAFSTWVENIEQQHPATLVAEVTPYETALAAHRTPFQILAWTNGLFVPQTRCWCTFCRRPIAMVATLCPFCGTEQPEDASSDNKDSDFDGMWDPWEIKNGFDPLDPKDAALDADGDCFVNLDEFRAEPATDPTNRMSHPAYGLKVEVESIKAVPFRLLFKSVSTLPGGGHTFALNTQSGGRTFFVKLGETVEGFLVKKFDPEFETRPSSTGPRKYDVSVLTLQRGNKLIPLVLRKPRSYFQHSVTLKFTCDASSHDVKTGDQLTLADEVYQVLTVDIQNRSVVIGRISDAAQFKVREGQTATPYHP